MSDIKFDKKALEALELIKQNKSVFITGQAGSGKSTFLRYIKDNVKDSIVLAPTGVAALNVEGVTIHKFFYLDWNLAFMQKVKVRSDSIHVMNNIKTIIIDEISMVRADIMDAIDKILRKVRANNNPFGGIQIILFGDLMQLPPILNNEESSKFFERYDGIYFFYAKVFNNFKINVIEFDSQYRQTDNQFNSILNRIRDGNIQQEDIDKLNERIKERNIDYEEVTLCTKNALSNSINKNLLSKIKANQVRYIAEIEGDFDQSATIAETELILKKEAKVIMLNNDTKNRWINGSIGTIKSLGAKNIKVEINGKEVSVQRYKWIKYSYLYKNKNIIKIKKGTFNQFPLKLAWAITIHKSQGLTIPKLVIDFSEPCFSHGQAYVAFSRGISLDTIKLSTKLSKNNFIIDPKAKEYKKYLQ